MAFRFGAEVNTKQEKPIPQLQNGLYDMLKQIYLNPGNRLLNADLLHFFFGFLFLWQPEF